MLETGAVVVAPTVHVHSAPPDVLTQRNAEAAVGVSPRTFLRELLPAFRAAGGEVAERGKLRMVRREAFVAWLMRGERAAATTEPASDGRALSVVEALGLEEAPTRRKAKGA